MLLLLLTACDPSLPGAAPALPEQGQQAEIYIPAEDEPWPHRWRAAAIVVVKPGLAQPRDLSQESNAERVDLSLDQALLRDAMVHRPVGVWMAAPGTTLSIADQKPASTEGPLPWTVPADAEAGTRYVLTEHGAHTLAWEASEAIREAEVALGFMPWRVIVRVGPTPAEAAPEAADALLTEPGAMRLRENGIVVLDAPAPVLLPVPWVDAPADHLDLASILGERTTGTVLAERGRAPRLASEGPSARILSEAGSYFQASLAPSSGGRPGRGGRR